MALLACGSARLERGAVDTGERGVNGISSVLTGLTGFVGVGVLPKSLQGI